MSKSYYPSEVCSCHLRTPQTSSSIVSFIHMGVILHEFLFKEQRCGDNGGGESSSGESCIPLSLIPAADLPVCVYEGLGLVGRGRWSSQAIFMKTSTP